MTSHTTRPNAKPDNAALPTHKAANFQLSPELRRAALLTGLTLLGLLVGLAAEHLLRLPALMWAGYGLAFLAGGIPAAREALHTLTHERQLDVDLLMVLAALGAASIGQVADGAILLFLFSLSNTLQGWAMGRTKNAIGALMNLHPGGATVLRGGVEKWCGPGDIRVGDTLLVRPGERIAADARVVEGTTAVDESPITGESRPIDKAAGAMLASGTVNLNGSVRARVVRPVDESTLARLTALMKEAQTQKSRTETLAERWESPYATLVLIAVPLVFAALYLAGGFSAAEAWYRAMTFMVVASPCAVVISTPAVMLSAMAAAARAGVLFKSSAALDALSKVRTIAFDKTGTLTNAHMSLTDIVAADKAELLALAAGLESHSEHPIAQAIVAKARQQGLALPSLTQVEAVPGHGIVGTVGSGGESGRVWAGNARMAEYAGATLTPQQAATLSELGRRGSSSVVVGRGTTVLGTMGVADTLRSDARSAIATLHHTGLGTVMLTGDRSEVAQAVARELGLSDYRAELLPQDKLQLIATLPAPVAMVGDGVNDAPALARADLGIAVGSGTDIAIESADVVLMQNNLRHLAGAIHLAQEAQRTVRFNLLFAFGIILLVSPLAVAGKIPLPLGVLAHEGGTVLVIFIGLRLLRHSL